MATMAEFVLDASTFRIGRAFGALPGVEVELERVVPLRNSIVPYAWVRGVTPDEVRRVLLERNAVQTVRVIDSLPEQGVLLHVEWDRAVEDALTALADLLGISRQSVGGRLRRGYRNLVGGTLVKARDRPGGD